jgi:hypothetical protein
MPRISATKGEEVVVKKAIKLAEQCITNAQVAYIENEGRFRQIFKSYFGNTTAASIDDLVYTLALMAMELKGDNYEIVAKPPAGQDNASIDAYSTPYGQARPEQKAADDAIWKQNRRKARSEMWLHPLFFSMPFATLDVQSQVETFMHELAHFSAGVIDYNPPQCYGFAGVTYCMSVSVDVAVRNAENVGMFLANFQRPI